MPFTKSIQQSKFVFAFTPHDGRAAVGARDSSIPSRRRPSSPTSRPSICSTGPAARSTDAARRRGAGGAPVSSLKALDLATGEVLWTQGGIPPAWKALMLRDEAIVAYPNPAENAAVDGDKGVGVFACRDGEDALEQGDR